MNNRNGLIIVPNVYWEQRDNFWGPGNGNIYFEIWQSALECENLGDIVLYKVKFQNKDWHLDVIELLSSHNIDFILMDVEQDPSGVPNWDSDLKIASIRKYWNGKIFLFSLDMAFTTHLMRASKIIESDKNSIVISIDRNVRKFFFMRGIGPLLAPISLQSINYIDSKLTVPLEKKYELTFIGTIYKQREKVLHSITDFGIPLSINPHQNSGERESYTNYIKTIMESKYTLNLSKAGRDPISQIKSRLLEASIFGTRVVTDSKNNITGNFPLKNGIIRFRNLKELKNVISNEEEISLNLNRSNEIAIRNEARIHATKNFWATLISNYF